MTSLADLTTLRVGGPASEVRVAHTAQELVAIAIELWRTDEPWLLLGSGSNTVVSDAGFPGTVVLVRNTGIDLVADDEIGPERVRLRVQAGHNWDELVAACVARGWSGIEALSGIPGLAGAAPIQNIGAYGQELSDVLHSIEFLERDTEEVVLLPADELELDYRSSAMKSGREGVVLSIDIVLHENQAHDNPPSQPIAYGQLANELGVTIGDRVSLRELRRAVLRLRSSKGMVLNEADHDTWSAGSFFTNPIVSEQFARSLPPNAPRFPVAGRDPVATVTSFEELATGQALRMPEATPQREFKLSAAWLIENSGITRGYRLPGSGAAISSKHTLAITNRGAATASDIGELARLVVQRVQSEFGIVLTPEPYVYGIEI